MNDNPGIVSRATTAIRNSATFKVLTIGFLILILLVPAGMVRGLIREREKRQEEVVEEIASKWGSSQTITGPVISVPYQKTVLDKRGKKMRVTEFIQVLPDELDISGEAFPEIRYRGIYETVLYNTTLKISGKLACGEFADLGITARDILWSDARISVGISDMRGIREGIEATINGEKVAMEPGIKNCASVHSGVSAMIPEQKRPVEISFELTINLNGSQRLGFIPVGKTTTASLKSSWRSPSFDGAFLPAKRVIGDSGFEAEWTVLSLNRTYPQYWVSDRPSMDSSSFGVSLIMPADNYQKTTRSAKYAILFIGLTFLAFFISEVLQKIRVHPVQYLLIGFGLIIFYTLLLSLSEHLEFRRAYAISSVATVVLIAAYARSVLRKRSLALLVGALLAGLYAYLYVLLQREDYSLLLGSAGLFVVLAVVMFVTRKVNWYSRD
jgi:inner membrane protein